MTQGWDALDAELAHWATEGLRLPLWWRDDDAIAPTEALFQLEALATRLNLPVHLAVIPETAQEELAQAVAQSSHLIPVVHGWAHKNHASADKKKCEFPSTRPVDEALNAAEQGMNRLKHLFGPALQPMFVPLGTGFLQPCCPGLRVWALLRSPPMGHASAFRPRRVWCKSTPISTPSTGNMDGVWCPRITSCHGWSTRS